MGWESREGDGPRHRFLDHASEWELQLEAPSLEGLFEEAGRAFTEALGGASARAGRRPEALSLVAPDTPALLVAFLNELVFRADARGRLYRDFHVSVSGPGALNASMRPCALPEGLRNPVKGASYHRLKVQRVPSGFLATVVLDV